MIEAVTAATWKLAHQLADISEPPGGALSITLFIVLFVTLVLAIYVSRAASDWFLAGPAERTVRWLGASVATLALLGNSLLLAELTLGPQGNKRIWLSLCIGLILLQLSYIAWRLYAARAAVRPDRGDGD